jgi:hypothetical protein
VFESAAGSRQQDALGTTAVVFAFTRRQHSAPTVAANRIARFLQNALILAAGDPGCPATMGSQITNFGKFQQREHCSLITLSGTSKQNDKT